MYFQAQSFESVFLLTFCTLSWTALRSASKSDDSAKFAVCLRLNRLMRPSMLSFVHHIFTKVPAFTVTAVLLGACGAPLGPIPGGALDGDIVPWPENWQHAEECENVLLQTNPDAPYSVTIWGVGIGQDFYVGASKRSHQWARYVEADPRVILEVDGQLYRALAMRVTDPATTQQVAEHFVAKYDIDRDNLSGEGAFYRLVGTP